MLARIHWLASRRSGPGLEKLTRLYWEASLATRGRRGGLDRPATAYSFLRMHAYHATSPISAACRGALDACEDETPAV